ncbi:MAG: hypothetical protein NT126_02595 [Bacteroidetes bacterium]|nr:hypothetical protein [Bacteroidota bacterium]
MDILNQVIEGMNKEQVRFFKMFISRRREAGSRKDAELFDYIRKSRERYDEGKIHRRLYQHESKNSFYRLKHRLLQDLNKSLMVQHFDDDEVVYILHLLALEKFYFNKNNTRTAGYFLKKAESEASRIENFELLDIIYGEFIKLSHELVAINPDTYIALRKKNQEQIHQLRAIDDILAAVSYQMKITQNFSSSANPVIPILQKTLKKVSKDKELIKSSTLRFKIYDAVSRILLQKREYKALEDYLLGIFHEFEKEDLFNRNNHDTKLQMIVFIVNTLFKNGKQKESLKYAGKLKEAMEEYRRLLYNKYLFFYYNSLVINYSKLDSRKAIEILDEMKANAKIRSTPFYEMFIYGNLAVLNFDSRNFHQSIRNLNKLYLLDAYKKADRSLQFKFAIAELMIRYELQDFDILEVKINNVKKDFKELLSKKESAREKEMLAIISRMIETDHLRKDKTLYNKIKVILGTKDEQTEGDSEIINYKNWLKEKIN